MIVQVSEKQTGPRWHRKSILVPTMVAFDVWGDRPYIEALAWASGRSAQLTGSAKRTLEKVSAGLVGATLDQLFELEGYRDTYRPLAAACGDLLARVNSFPPTGEMISVDGEKAALVYTGVMWGIGHIAAGNEGMIDELYAGIEHSRVDARAG